MRPQLNWIVIVTFIAAPALLWSAMPAVAQPAGQQRVGQHDISSFLSDDVCAVSNINLKKIDLERTQKWAEKLAKDVDSNGDEQLQAMGRLGREFGQFEAWATYMKEAGAENVYLLLNARDDKLMPVIVVPGIEDRQVDTVKTLLTPVRDDPRFSGELQTTRIRDAVVLAPPQLIQQFQQPRVAMDDALKLNKALDEVEGAAIRTAFRPDKHGRKVMREMADTFPDEQFEGIRWVAMGFDYPDKEDRGFRMILKADNSERAEQVKQRWNEKIARFSDDDDAQLAAARIGEHSDALEAKAEDDTVIVTLTNEQSNKVLKDVLLPMAQAKQEQRN